VTVIQRSQVNLVFYKFSSLTAAALLNFSGCGCLPVTQAQSVYQDLFKFNGLCSFIKDQSLLRSIQVQLTVVEAKEGKKKVMIVNFNELATTELIVSMDDKISKRRVTFKLGRGCKTMNFVDRNVFLAW
jgi:hypothetical protein